MSGSISFTASLSSMHCLSSDVELSRPYDETDDVLIEVLEPLAGSKRDCLDMWSNGGKEKE